MLLLLTILTMSLPFLGYLTSSSSYTSNYEEIAIRQFFRFLRDDVIKATTYRVDSNIPSTLILEQYDDKTVKFEQYGSLIRRRVDRRGHEIYLRDIKQVAYTPLPNGIRATVTSLQGEEYEKTIIFYK